MASNSYKPLVMAYFCFLGICLFCLSAASAEISPQYQADFEAFMQEVEQEYAALDLKQAQGLVDIIKLRQKYQQELATVDSQQTFHRLIQRLIAEFQDSHFATRVKTDQLYHLGFQTDLIDGHIVITDVDRDILDIQSFPAQKGDRIIHWNHQPVSKELAKIRPYIGKSSSQTADRYSAMLLPLREGQEVPLPSLDKPVSLTIRSADSQAIYQVTLSWKAGKSKDFLHPYCDREASDFPLPPQSTVLKPQIAYYHPHPDNPKTMVGYLRIPDYLIEPQDVESRLKTYAHILQTLEAHTDVLVIDQRFNCGGNVEFAELLMGLFHQQEYTPVQYRFLASQHELAYWKQTRQKMAEKNASAAQRLEIIIETLRKHHQAGDKLTDLHSLFGQTAMVPFKVYTHPILLLVNEFAGSAGDVFPAYMQYSSRARLMGYRTMGAGGHARMDFVLPHSKIKIKIPKMLFYLPDGTALENRGAHPEEKYIPGLPDLAANMRPFQYKYLQKALEIFKQSTQ